MPGILRSVTTAAGRATASAARALGDLQIEHHRELLHWRRSNALAEYGFEKPKRPRIIGRTRSRQRHEDGKPDPVRIGTSPIDGLVGRNQFTAKILGGFARIT